jgi:stearoyl-CoA desaturase (delta-9 desaturase)
MTIDPDKIFKNYYVTKLRIIYFASILLISLWIYFEAPSWWQMLIVFYAGLLFARIGSETGFHRYFAHRSFKTTPFKEKLLLWWGTILGVGSCISWATMHRIHHAHADTEDDPHSPYFSGWIKPFLGIPEAIEYDHRVTKDLIRDKHQLFTHRNYFKIQLCVITALSVISFFCATLLPLVLFYCMASVSLWLLYGITNTVEHLYGYRTYETKDWSGNHHWIRFLWLGAGLHNNHHYNSQSPNFNLRNNWWEFDCEYFIIKNFFLVKN